MKKQNKPTNSKSIYIAVLLLVVVITGVVYYWNNFYLPKSEAYLIKIKYSNNNHFNSIRDEAEKIGLKFANSNPVKNFYYDTTINKSDYWESDKNRYIELVYLPYNNQYPKKIYKDSRVEISVSPYDVSALPYIQNAEYCQQNGDCNIRNNICTSGSYNKYQVFMEAYGCEGPSGEYDKKGDCYRDTVWSNPKCVNNKCTADKKLSDTCYKSYIE